MSHPIYDAAVTKIDGTEGDLNDIQGKVALIVNVASQCGFTPQYKGLQELHDRFKDQGFAVLGFPCNQFGAQEPGSNEEISNFCTSRFDVKFPMYGKIEVNGGGTHPLYAHLKSEAPGVLGSKAIKWNFTKFLVDKDGKVIDRFASATSPDAIAPKVEALLR
ncbi:MAG: glutathione peroxidase [Myxococcota bacterium]